MARLATAGDALLAAVLAPACVVCTRVLDAPSGGPACDTCWGRLPCLTPPLCDRCGHPLPTRSASDAPHVMSDGGCVVCRDWPSGLVTRMRAIGPYAGVLRQLLHALKYTGRRTIAPRLGALLGRSAAEVLAGADAVVPVPLHRARHWERGFNQADLLAQGLGLPVWRVLRRVRRTPPQASLASGARRENVGGAFRLRLVARWRQQVRGRCLVLVDDVTTTGGTLLACAAALKDAGAAEVRAAVTARTVLEHAVPAVSGARAVR